ncbi:MAG: diacylglycerol kinase family lipid kinase [Isosphaeraceae bacterium]
MKNVPRDLETPTQTRADRATSAFVVLNPKSGGCDADQARETLNRHLSAAGVACRFHEPSEGDSLGDRVRESVRSGCDLVIAAGGDGTVSAVADALAGAEVPLGIVPLGTANVLAGELGVPLGLDDACALLAGDHTLTRIDAMEVAGKHYVTQVGVGLDAMMIRDTSHQEKRRFGRGAYIWTALTQFVGFRARRFTLTVDGATTRPRALQILVANSGTLGARPFRWGPDIRLDDGRLDVCVIRARTVFDVLALGWHFVRGQHQRDPNVRYLSASREVAIDSSRPFPVQADGEIIGETPVTVRVIPSALRVIVPRPPAASGSSSSRGSG